MDDAAKKIKSSALFAMVNARILLMKYAKDETQTNRYRRAHTQTHKNEHAYSSHQFTVRTHRRQIRMIAI